MSKLKAARGTQDILPDQSSLWQDIEAVAMRVIEARGFKEIRTPIFESTELFARAVGESSDIVNKEIYSFLDKSDRSLTLRPEATAAIARAYIEHSLDMGPRPFKAWYRGPMFRYERPQTGRYRQFHQIGVELLGSSSPMADLELISMGLELLSQLGLKDLTLHINSLGNSSTRKNYREALLSFLTTIENQICEDCKRRMLQNPLRVLDCKVPADQALYDNAPLLSDYYDADSQAIWSKILSGIDKLGLAEQCQIVINPKLVRGLDYYNHSVFEIQSLDPNLGQQNTVLAGGRYDGLVSSLGGPETPSAGWALGVERLALLMGQSSKPTHKLYIISDDTLEAMSLASKLRAADSNLVIDYDYEAAKIGKQLEKALKKSAQFVIFYLADERASSSFKIKKLSDSSEKVFHSIDDVILFTHS